jgi:hypothetical protein
VFDPVRSYDKPGVIITQLANGIATTDSVRRVLFDPAALSPRERESFADKLKQQYGGGSVVDTAIDVLTNPVVWLGVLTATGGGVAAANLAGGKRFFGAPTGAGAYAAQNFPWLRQLGLTSGLTESIGRRIAPLAQVVINDMENARGKLGEVMQREVAQVLRNVSAHHGVEVTRLDPESAPNEAVAKSLREIRGVMATRRLGWDQDRTETVAAGVEPERYHIRVTHQPGNVSKARTRSMAVDKELHDVLLNKFKRVRTGAYGQVLDRAKNKTLLKSMPGFRSDESMFESMERLGLDHVTFRLGLRGEKVRPRMADNDPSLDAASLVEGGIRTKWEQVERKKLVGDTASLEAVENRFGLKGLQAAEKRLYETGRVMLAGDEAAYAEGRGFVANDQKILRVARSQLQSLERSGYLTEGGNIEVGGEEAVRALLSDEVSSQLLRAAEQRTGTKIRVGATRAEIEKVVVDAYKKAFEDPFYMPRNTTEARDAQGRRVQFNPYTGQAQVQGGDNPTVSGRTMMRQRTAALPWDPEDLQFIADNFGGTMEMHRLIRNAKERVQGQLAEGNIARVYRVAPDVAASKYVASTARDYAVFARDAASNPHVQAVMRDYTPGPDTKTRLAGPLGLMRGGGASAGVRELEAIPEDMKPVGGFNMWDLMDADLDAAAKAFPNDPHSVDLWRKHVIPATLGIKGQDEAAHMAAASKIREQALALANSGLMRAVEKMGSYPAKFVQELRAWGADPMGDATLPWQAVTKTLYASHLGLNMGSAIINLLQPLQSVHQLGFKNTVEAYWQGLEMIGQYTKERSRLGVGATAEQIAAARQRAFSRAFGGRAVDLTQVAELGSTWDMVERAGYGVTTTTGKPKFNLLETMMKPFQTAETLNRVVTANAVLNAYQRAGRTGGMDYERAVQDAAGAVQFFQFGGSPINRPGLFYKDFAKNPAFRQFAQYGLRSFANLFTAPVMMGGTRKFGPMEVTGRAGITLVDLTRMAAVSAVAYEIGKNMLGADISRGLAFGGPFDIIGGQDALQKKNFPMYIPPVVDIGWDVARYLGTGDSEILTDWAPRVLPGGVAVSRALGVMPEIGAAKALGLQKTYADWSQSQSGNVPMYDDQGRYMGAYPTSDVVLRALGADLGRFNNPQEMTQFLLKNREQIREGRRQFISAVLGNNMSAAMKVKVAFEKRFGMPLTVTQAQMKDAIKTREESIVSRTMSTIDKDLRGQYVEAVQQFVPGQLQRAPMEPTEQGDMYRWGLR